MCSLGRATAMLSSRHPCPSPISAVCMGGTWEGGAAAKVRFSLQSTKTVFGACAERTPMPFVATRRQRAMIRQWRKDPLARPRPYFPCRRSSCVEGKRERGAYRRSLPVYLLGPLGLGQLRPRTLRGIDGSAGSAEGDEKRQRRRGPIAHYRRPAAQVCNLASGSRFR